ncbi:MAG: ImmA/IrrE family metallo-endopeptidase [Candidatus Aminicenantes bacterium]|nr:ImmA/IrrE family metallo-endopeptidase [Candidatus Aminicenantes bacterium]
MTADPSRKVPETPFGMRLRAARKMAGMSMEDLASKLGGRVTKQAISKYETGRMMPSPEVLEKLVEALKTATWGASPLRIEDAGLNGQLPLESVDRPQESGAPRPVPALRRRGLLSLLKRAGPDGRVEAARSLEAPTREALYCLSIVGEALPSRSGGEREETAPDSLAASLRSRGDIDALADRRARYLEAWRADAAVNEIKFRAGERLSAKAGSALQYRVADDLRRVLELESLLGVSATFENPIADGPARASGDVEAAAAEVRGRWELGSGPVVNLLGLLEDRGIKVYEARGIEGFEGLSGRFGPCPFVAVSVDFPADRIRFTAAHELGHILCGFPSPEDSGGSRGAESECHAFGAAFLLPRAALERTFTPARRKVTLGELGEIKSTYGISLQAIMYRAHALGFVGDRRLRAFRETIKARGWTVEEPVAYDGRERATRFRRLLHYAVAAGIMDVSRAAGLAGVAAEELAKEIGEIF